MSNQPTERDVEALARLLARVDVNPHAAAVDRARAILTSDWYAERITEARREEAAEALGQAELEIRGAASIPIGARAAICAVLRGRAAALRGDA